MVSLVHPEPGHKPALSAKHTSLGLTHPGERAPGTRATDRRTRKRRVGPRLPTLSPSVSLGPCWQEMSRTLGPGLALQSRSCPGHCNDKLARPHTAQGTPAPPPGPPRPGALLGLGLRWSPQLSWAARGSASLLAAQSRGRRGGPERSRQPKAGKATQRQGGHPWVGPSKLRRSGKAAASAPSGAPSKQSPRGPRPPTPRPTRPPQEQRAAKRGPVPPALRQSPCHVAGIPQGRRDTGLYAGRPAGAAEP